MSKYSLGKSGLYSSRFRSGVAAIFSPRVRRERARRDGFRPDITDEDVRERYYSRDLTIEDVVKYGLYDDVDVSELDYYYRDTARRIGMHNLANIDLATCPKLESRILSAIWQSDLTPDATKEEVEAIVLQTIRERLESRYTSYEEYKSLCELDITKKHFPEFVVEFPEDKKELEQAYKDGNLTIEQVTQNMDVFGGKRYITRLSERDYDAFSYNGVTEEKYQYICENFPELLELETRELIWASREVDIEVEPETNRERIANYYRQKGLSNETVQVAVKFIPLEDILASKIETAIFVEPIMEFVEEIGEKKFLECFPIEFVMDRDSNAYDAIHAAETFGITPIIEFERENGPLFLGDKIKNLGKLNSDYLHYAGNRDPKSPANLFVKPYSERNRSYTLEEFSETMRRVILYGPSNGETKVKLDYRSLRGPFRDANPDLFISEDAPQELQDKFYTTKITMKDIEEHPEYLEYLTGVNLDMCLVRPGAYFEDRPRAFYSVLEEVATRQEVLEFIRSNTETISYSHKRRDVISMEVGMPLEQIQETMERRIEDEIKSRVLRYSEDAPAFFREAHPEMFLDETAPEELKLYFYDDYLSHEGRYAEHHSSNYPLSFSTLNEHPEWSEFLKGKNISRAMPESYEKLFDLMGEATLMRLAGKNAISLDEMARQHREQTLMNWYKATGGKFIPHHAVMLNYPEREMDSFLRNGAKWSRVIGAGYSSNYEEITATLKIAYSMGVFHGNDAGFKKVIDLLTLPPSNITAADYEKIMAKFVDNPQVQNLIKEAYILGEDGRYTYKTPTVERSEGMDVKQMKKKVDEKVADIRWAVEISDVSTVLTADKAHRMFDSFEMRYDPKFVDFFVKYQEEILSNPDYIKDISLIQRRFAEITRDNAGRTLTLELAAEYIRNSSYDNVDIGNEGLAEQARIAGYSQRDYDKLQVLYNEGEMRDRSSIPRVTGEKDGYTYEMLRCDDPLALVVGTLTDCCQEINGAGQSSMEHSVLSKDGRVFVVRDPAGRIVAQSWFWRNQYTGCFDNIEIPDKIFTTYEREHPEEGRSGLTRTVLGVYKQATLELMQEDEHVYRELLEAGTITHEQYDALRLGKVTIGLGYNDIKETIRTDSEMHRDTNPRGVIEGGVVPHPYTDAGVQYIIAEREGLTDSNYENLHVHEDTVPIYDSTNLPVTTVVMMKKMEAAAGRDDIHGMSVLRDGLNKTSSELVSNIAREYWLNPETTKIAATSRMALVYSAEEVGPVTIASVLTAPPKEGVSEEEQKQAAAHIEYQLKKALRQITANGKRVLNIDGLPEEDRVKVEGLLATIKKENEERGTRE